MLIHVTTGLTSKILGSVKEARHNKAHIIYVQKREICRDRKEINDCLRECSNYRTIALISHTSKVMLKILQERLQQYVNRELPDVQAAFRKGRRTRDQIANIHWIIEKARDFQENIYFCLVTMPKPLTV